MKEGVDDGQQWRGKCRDNAPPFGGAGGGLGKGGAGGQGNGGAGGLGGPGNGGPGPAGGGPGKPGGPFSHEPPVACAVAGGQPKRKAREHAKKVSEVLGELVWLMSQSRATSGRCATGHKQFFISDLEWPVADATNGECS